MSKSLTKHFSLRDLDNEIARRKMFPPCLDFFPGTEENKTAAELELEFNETPRDHYAFAWRRWELALAARQVQLGLGDSFYRIVHEFGVEGKGGFKFPFKPFMPQVDFRLPGWGLQAAKAA
jgi:hypothetical protein